MIKQERAKVNRGHGSSMETEKKVLTVEELAKELRISKNLAYRQVREGRIYSIKCGDRYLIPVRSLEELLSGEQRRDGNGDGEGGGGIASACRFPQMSRPESK